MRGGRGGGYVGFVGKLCGLVAFVMNWGKCVVWADSGRV